MSIRRSASTGGLPGPTLAQRRRLASPGGLIVRRTPSQEMLSEGFRALDDDFVLDAERPRSLSEVPSTTRVGGSTLPGITSRPSGPTGPSRPRGPSRPGTPSGPGTPSRPATPGGSSGGPARRRVVFESTPKLGRNSIPITPYALIYGRHPDHFNFDRLGKMRLTPEGIEAREQGVQPWTPTVPTKGFACVKGI